MKNKIICHFQTGNGFDEMIQGDLTTTNGYYRRMCKINSTSRKMHPFTRIDFYHNSSDLYAGKMFKTFIA